MIIVDLIAGARPNFVKIASLVKSFEKARNDGLSIRARLVHTGQHYDKSMSEIFFEQLGIPQPDINLEVGSGTQAEQTAGIMIRYESLLTKSPSSLCVVVGDVTSTLACSLVARKVGIPVAHVEAGIRSGDWSMPEEINRVVTDALSNYFFTTSELAGTNLKASGVDPERIFFVGNTMIDTLLANRERLKPPSFWREAKLEPRGYLVLTLHRPSNVDDSARLGLLLETIAANARDYSIIFPVHPRTHKVLASLEISKCIRLVPPQPYLEFNYLVENAIGVITDSGGVTEEATVLKIPCMTLRSSTERPETVSMGTNELLGSDPSAIPPAMAKLFEARWKKGKCPPMWDGKTGNRIVREIIKILKVTHREN